MSQPKTEKRTSVCGWVTLARREKISRLAKADGRYISQMVDVLLGKGIEAYEREHKDKQ